MLKYCLGRPCWHRLAYDSIRRISENCPLQWINRINTHSQLKSNSLTCNNRSIPVDWLGMVWIHCHSHWCDRILYQLHLRLLFCTVIRRFDDGFLCSYETGGDCCFHYYYYYKRGCGFRYFWRIKKKTLEEEVLNSQRTSIMARDSQSFIGYQCWWMVCSCPVCVFYS